MKTVRLQNETIPSIALGTWSWGTGGGAGGDAVFGNYLTAFDLKPVFDAAMEAGFNFIGYCSSIWHGRLGNDSGQLYQRP